MIKLNEILTEKDIEFLRTKISFGDYMTNIEFNEFGDLVVNLETSAVMNEADDINQIADIVTKITTSEEW